MPFKLNRISPHESGENLQILGLGDVAEDKLSDGADEGGEEDPVGVQAGNVLAPAPAGRGFRYVERGGAVVGGGVITKVAGHVCLFTIRFPVRIMERRERTKVSRKW